MIVVTLLGCALRGLGPNLEEEREAESDDPCEALLGDTGISFEWRGRGDRRGLCLGSGDEASCYFGQCTMASCLAVVTFLRHSG